MLTYNNYVAQNESNNNIEQTRKLLLAGKYDILMFTIGGNLRDDAMLMKGFLREIGINKYDLLDSYELFDPEMEVYVMFTEKAGTHNAFELMVFGSIGIYGFFEDIYPDFKKPSPIMTPKEFMDYVNKTALFSAKMMYSPRKITREI